MITVHLHAEKLMALDPFASFFKNNFVGEKEELVEIHH